MFNDETILPTTEFTDCRNCKFRGAMFRDTRIFCNQSKTLVDIMRCNNYEKDDALPDELLHDEPNKRKSKKNPSEKIIIENESLDKIVDFFAADCSWNKLRRILTKDVLSTTVLLNYLEHNDNAKKKFMNALIVMSQKEIKELN